jgi:hypothetical protein
MESMLDLMMMITRLLCRTWEWLPPARLRSFWHPLLYAALYFILKVMTRSMTFCLPRASSDA